MIKTYVLIMVLAGGYETGKATVQQEFNSLSQCEYVRKELIKQANASRTSTYTVASGCFEK